MRFNIIYLLLALICNTVAKAQQPGHLSPGNGNPIIPGYFADPTVKKFNDTYYIYATTDGNGGGLGPSQVWTSKDFVNWTMQDMNWPTTHNYWAPDVAKGNDGKYYLYYCQPTVEVYGASSATPVGPWTPLFADGKAVIKNYLVPGVITLDGQTFRDDDGQFYMTWGTWGIYKGFGCGVGLLNPDMRTFAKTAKIPNTDATDFFEAPFMFKRKGLYYLLYSSGYCENETYRVQYAVSKTGPMSNFVFGKNNPVLATTPADGSVHGPGHQSVLQVGDDYYLVYHRHNNPHSNGGYHRQVCADKLLFDAEGNILKVVPTHTGIGFLGKNTIQAPNLAYQQKVTASSFYNDDYQPAFATDDNNGTLWKPKTNSSAAQWLQVDLGKMMPVKTVLTQFEYASWYYQYKIEYATDGKHWQLFADKRSNTWHGSPYVDKGNVRARYLRLTITNTGYPGLFKSVWNFKVYGEDLPATIPVNIHQASTAAIYQQKGLLIDLDASKMPLTSFIEWKNNGSLKGIFKTSGNALVTDFIAGKKAIVFNGKQFLKSDFKVPRSLSGNSSYTVSFNVFSPKIKDENPVLNWSGSTEQLTGATFGYGKNRDIGAVQHFGFADMPYQKIKPDTARWHQVTITFDGVYEKIYVDGILDSRENKMLFVQTAPSFLLGSKNDGQVCFSGALASLKVYDYALDDAAVKKISAQTTTSDILVYTDAAKLNYGLQTGWNNEGTAAGSFITVTEKLLVKDVSDRLAVCFEQGATIKLSSKTLQNAPAAYSFATGFYADENLYQQPEIGWYNPSPKIAGKNSTAQKGWHFLVQTIDQRQVKIYVDGILTNSFPNKLPTGNSLLIGNAEQNKQSAIANFMMFNHVLSDPEIEKLNQNWLQNLHPPFAGEVSFKQKPKAISPQLVEMEAVIPQQKNDLQYYFIRQNGSKIEKESGWTNQPYYLDGGLQANQSYNYLYKIRDYRGNVTAFGQPQTVRTDASAFTVFTDDFSAKQDYLSETKPAVIWDGLVGKGAQQTAVSMNTEANVLKLASENSNWDGNYPYGPFLYKTVKGDFTAQVNVADVSGLAQKQVAGNNDVGLMVRAANDFMAPNHAEQLLQNSVFPAWNVGNMLTNFTDGNRQQTNNQSGWNFDRFLQIQRAGDLFYTRISSDGITWRDLPGSPVLRTDLKNKPVQVGLYQCTYGPKSGYGCFADFKLYQ